MLSLRQKQEAAFNALENDNAPVSIVSIPGSYEHDSRICLTMVFFLPIALSKRVTKEIVGPLKTADPKQYFYPFDSLHLTIQNVKVVADPPNFSSKEIELVRNLSLYFKKHNPLFFELNGLLKMKNSAFIKAYPDAETQEFILSLRKKLEEIGVPDDKSYSESSIVTGGITFCRFYTASNNAFMKYFNRIKNIDLGKLRVDKVSLISTNAVAYINKTKVLAEFKFK